MRISFQFRTLWFVLVASSAPSLTALAAEPQVLVPGTGTRLTQVGDDFEKEDWVYHSNSPKSSQDIDENQRTPGGESKNGRWYEGIKRGDPDVVKRVATPPDGLSDSKGSLLLRSLYTGIPGRPSYQMHQDDFICNVNYILGGSVPVSQRPSVVTRVWIPPFEHWERRTGPSFALRAAVVATGWGEPEDGGRKFYGRHTYWPGMFICFETKADGGAKEDGAYIRVRANPMGHEYMGPRIKEHGWWTLGMSFTPNGQIHYFAKPGVEDLTAKDRIASDYPYGYRCEWFKTFFYNVCSADDGRRWSTPWIIDDAAMYYIETTPRVTAKPKSSQEAKKQAE